MLYINSPKNSLIFDEKDFKIDKNYLPMLVLAFRELDKDRPINFAIELEKTPIIFILFLRKLLKETDAKINIYFKENSESLRAALKSYDIIYKPLSDFPDIKRN
jgi:hypothetical protein